MIVSVKQKFYVVWKGRQTGVFGSWDEAKEQVSSFSGASYKSFKTLNEAQTAFELGPDQSLTTDNTWVPEEALIQPGIYPKEVLLESIAVDAACAGNPGVMEYRGVFVKTGEILFEKGPFQQSTNNIGEFLALVHAIGYQKQNKLNYPIYTDSLTARAWVRNKLCKSTLKQMAQNQDSFDLIKRAETFLKQTAFNYPVLTWNTKAWGEIPADFGRK